MDRTAHGSGCLEGLLSDNSPPFHYDDQQKQQEILRSTMPMESIYNSFYFIPHISPPFLSPYEPPAQVLKLRAQGESVVNSFPNKNIYPDVRFFEYVTTYSVVWSSRIACNIASPGFPLDAHNRDLILLIWIFSAESCFSIPNVPHKDLRKYLLTCWHRLGPNYS